jgi:hypothetical protein
MASTPKKIAEYLRTVDSDYKDNRILTELEHRSLVWFFLYGQNVFSQIGWDWRGAIFRQKGEQCLLVVKAGTQDTPLVGFITDRTPIDCVRVFCRRWHAGTQDWYADNYP